MSAADLQPVSSASSIPHLVALVVTSSRLIGGLANLPLFKNVQISLTEWLALSVLADKEGVSNKMLARSLGVTGQRANQLCTSLNEAKLISTTHAEDDSRRNVIRITDAGRNQLGNINAQLQELVSSGLKGKRRSLIVAGKQMRYVMRIVQAGTPQKAANKLKRKAKTKPRKDGTNDVAGKQ